MRQNSKREFLPTRHFPLPRDNRIGRGSPEPLLTQHFFGDCERVSVSFEFRQLAHQRQQLRNVRFSRFSDVHDSVWPSIGREAVPPPNLRSKLSAGLDCARDHGRDCQPSQKNLVGRLISSGRLLWTGQLSAVCSKISR